jgi:hypothetical protein
MPTESIPVYQQNLSKAQKEAYEIQRSKIFKGTISVCVIYAVVATLILLVTLFTNFGKTVLADSLFPFTITVIAGMILIVVILGISVSNYKPPEITFDTYNSLSCPDYYTLEKVAKSDLDTYPKEKQPYLNYRCKANPNVYPVRMVDSTQYLGIGTSGAVGIGTTNSSVVGIGTNSPYYTSMNLTGTASTQWQKYYTDINTNINTAGGGRSFDPKKCDTVYPYLLANYDSLNDNPTVLHCEWSKQCKVPWSSVCPKL